MDQPNYLSLLCLLLWQQSLFADSLPSLLLKSWPPRNALPPAARTVRPAPASLSRQEGEAILPSEVWESFGVVIFTDLRFSGKIYIFLFLLFYSSLLSWFSLSLNGQMSWTTGETLITTNHRTLTTWVILSIFNVNMLFTLTKRWSTFNSSAFLCARKIAVSAFLFHVITTPIVANPTLCPANAVSLQLKKFSANALC